MEKKKFVFDLAFNIIASIIPIVVLQLIAYPIIGRAISAENYGVMITLYSMIQLISGTLGTGLNNVRLIKEVEYEEKDKGNFNYILSIDCVIVIVVCFISTWYYQQGFDIVTICCVLIIAILLLLNSYIDVEYRIKLNFKKILFTNIAHSLGYILGLILFTFFKRWEIIFICGQITCLIYNMKNTNILKEHVRKSAKFKELVMDTIYIYISGFCTRAISYADKIMLLPLIGGTSVSVYYTATLLGKVVLLGLNPINSVILSYLNKKNNVKNKVFRMYFISGLVLCTVGYFLCIAISEPILGLLFPQWIDDAMRYIPITTLSLCIITLCNFLTPFTLKFCEMRWQFIINFITMIVYVFLSLILLKICGLIGFCWGISISYFIKLIITLSVYVIGKRESINADSNIK